MPLFSITMSYQGLDSQKRTYKCLRGRFSSAPPVFDRAAAEDQAKALVKSFRNGTAGFPKAKKGTEITWEIQEVH